MPRRQGPGYIYIPNWEKFQHYQTGKRGANPPAWIKLHLELLGNDAWLDLNPSDAKLLLSIWMVVARFGNGRAKADESWLRAQAKTPKGSLERLNHAGFVHIRASKALADRYQPASPEVKRKRLNQKKEEGATGTAGPNGQPAAPKKKVTPLTEDDANWVYPPEWHELQAQRAREKDDQ